LFTELHVVPRSLDTKTPSDTVPAYNELSPVPPKANVKTLLVSPTWFHFVPSSLSRHTPPNPPQKTYILPATDVKAKVFTPQLPSPESAMIQVAPLFVEIKMPEVSVAAKRYVPPEMGTATSPISQVAPGQFVFTH
jgi:hypothetical protein